MKALVSGATGFIGGALVHRLLDLGWEVNALVRPASLARLPDRERLSIFAADLQVENTVLEQAVDGCAAVFHAAAIRNRWGTSPKAYVQANVEGTRRLVEAAAGKAGRFVYVSSVGVYGRPGVVGVDENFPLAPQPEKPDYHSTKAQAEQIVANYVERIETVIVRPSITYGPGDQDGMLTRMVGLIARGRYVRIGNGMNHLHLVFIDDLVNGLLKAATHPGAVGQTFILAGLQPTRVRDLVAQVERTVGRSSPSIYLPVGLARAAAYGVAQAYRLAARLGLAGPGSSPPVTPDSIDTLSRDRGFTWHKAQSMLGYQPRVELAEGVKTTIEWMVRTGRLEIHDRNMQAKAAQTGVGE